MAGKRPAKTGLTREKEVKVGTYVKYIGLGNQRYSCPQCYISFKRGFFVEEKGINACSRNCLQKQIAKQA